MEFDGPYMDKPVPEERLNDDPDYLAEREKLRQAGIAALAKREIGLMPNGCWPEGNYLHLNKCDRKK